MALSLWQPWAGLVALGAKVVDTRSWGTTYRGPVAVHAAKRWTKAERAACRRIADGLRASLLTQEARAVRTAACELEAWSRLRTGNAAILGAVVAVAELAWCAQMDPYLIQQASSVERLVGDWQPGRWAWGLCNVRPLRESLPLRGRQGLWGLTSEQEAAVQEAAA